MGITKSMLYYALHFFLMFLAFTILTDLVHSLVLCLFLLTFLSIYFEGAVVVLFAFIPEVLPKSSNVYVGLFITLLTLAFAISAIIAPILWHNDHDQIFLSNVVSTVLSFIALLFTYLIYKLKKNDIETITKHDDDAMVHL